MRDHDESTPDVAELEGLFGHFPRPQTCANYICIRKRGNPILFSSWKKASLACVPEALRGPRKNSGSSKGGDFKNHPAV